MKRPEGWIFDRVSKTHMVKLNVTYVINGLLIQILGRDNLLNDLLFDLLSQSLGGDVLTVLSTDNNGVNSDRDNSSVIVLVLDGDLSLGIRSQPWQASVSAGSRHSSIELVCQLKSQGEQLRGLIGGISEHDTLITSTQLFKCLLIMQTLSNIGGLLLDGDQHVASLVVETLCGIIVTNVLDCISNDFLIV